MYPLAHRLRVLAWAVGLTAPLAVSLGPGVAVASEADTDGDGLADDVELFLGTRPDLADTDGGGTEDGREITERTDPLNGLDDGDADLDGDGVSNRLERTLGTDPFDSDSDDDGLLDAVEAGLAADADPETRTSPTRADTDQDGLSDGDEDTNRNGRLDPLETDPLAADTDGGGTDDGTEVRLGTDPIRRDDDPDGDVDGDGLTNAEEQALGTNPRNADGDNDGLTDFVEVRVSGTNPRAADTDRDGIADGTEDADRDGRVDPDETDPTMADTDRGGSSDGEERRLGTDPRDPSDDPGADADRDGLSVLRELSLGTNPNDDDTDDDGLLDGVEVDGGTDPLERDTDDDGLDDGQEDTNGNGERDQDETDPKRADSDGGGTEDGRERADGTDPLARFDDLDRDADHDGLSARQEREFGGNPDDADTDDDGVEDGAEPDGRSDSDDDGLVGVLDPDSDDDGLPDGLELGIAGPLPDTAVARGRFVADTDPETQTDPLRPDTDGGGVVDGVEDADRDGRVDADETDPVRAADDALGPPDSDADGLTDRDEARLGLDPNDADTDDDGLRDGQERLPGVDVDLDGKPNGLDPDSDDDGIPDGRESGLARPGRDTGGPTWVPDADPSTTTDPLRADTDGGGLPDGTEDRNRNGAVDPGETDPLDPTDDGQADRDLDGLPDAVEQWAGTDPDRRDSDGDGIEDALDGLGDADGDGMLDAVEADADDDGTPDGEEDTNLNGRVDPGERDPRRADTPGAEVDQGAPLEEPDASGPADAEPPPEDDAVVVDDRAPLELDTDGDGLSDDEERLFALDPDDDDTDDDGLADGEDGLGDADADGQVDAADPDADGDGLLDGTEAGRTQGLPGTRLDRGRFRADVDPTQTTDRLEPDTDGDGRLDGSEDANHNGRLDDGETDPNEVDRTDTDDSLSARGGAGCQVETGVGPGLPLTLLFALFGLVLFRRRPRLGLLLLILAPGVDVLTSRTALAAPGNRLEPALGRNAGIVQESARLGPTGTSRLGVRLHHAHEPLVAIDDNGSTAARILGPLTMLEVHGSVALYERVLIGAALPFSVYAEGDEVNLPGASGQPDSPALGDLRLVFALALVPRREHGFGFTLAIPVTAPTGSTADHVGEDGVVYAPRLGVEGAVGAALLAANVGYRGRPSQRVLDAVIDDELIFGASVAVEGPRGLVGEVAFDGGTGTAQPFEGAGRTRLEALGRARIDALPALSVGLGGGLGLLEGVGTPAWRALVEVAWVYDPASEQPLNSGPGVVPVAVGATVPVPVRAPDPDLDGIVGASDLCPNAPEDTDGFRDDDGCPETDNDGDNIEDARDKCPAAPEDVDGNEDDDGCPDLDDDRDQVPTPDDQCPRMPEDRDGVADEDGCPEEDPRPLPTRSGDATLTGDLVQTSRTIDFKGDTMTLLPSARAVLADVAALLAIRSDIKRLRVEAHTDSVGDDALNQARAQRRAEVVCGVLAEYGVETSRLVPVGVGEAQPIESNSTAEGRALNRRIELHVDAARN
jgi:outer membrane protein OmpA-like peptidoglycan-associated protein